MNKPETTDLEYIARLIRGELVKISHNALLPPFGFRLFWISLSVQENIWFEWNVF